MFDFELYVGLRWNPCRVPVTTCSKDLWPMACFLFIFSFSFFGSYSPVVGCYLSALDLVTLAIF